MKEDLAMLSVSLSSDSEEEEECEEDVDTLREQLATLTHSLTALSEQKAHMEAVYHADKKKMLVCTYIRTYVHIWQHCHSTEFMPGC